VGYNTILHQGTTTVQSVGCAGKLHTTKRLVFIAPNHQVLDLVYGKNMEQITGNPVNSLVKYGKHHGIHGFSAFFPEKTMANDQRKNHTIIKSLGLSKLRWQLWHVISSWAMALSEM
jgi:hypothetical protein